MDSCDQADLSKDYFVIQKLLLKCIGLSLKPKQGIIYRLYSVFLLILLVSFPYLIFSDLFKSQTDFNDFVNNLLYGAGCSIATSKQIVIFFKGRQLKKIMDTLENAAYLYDFKYREDSETISIKNCINFSRKLSLGGATMGICTIAFGVLTTFLTKTDENDHPLPFGTISVLTDRMDYKIVFMYESVVLFAAVIIYMMADVIYASIVLHICVQLRILQNFIRRMDKIGYTLMTEDKNFKQDETDEFDSSDVEWKYLQQMLKETVLYHMVIFDISKEAEDLFNVIIFTETVGMSIACCFVLHHATLFPMTDFHFQKDIAVLSCAIGTLMLMSYFGNEVIVESKAIADACYEVSFVGTNIKFQKGLILITQRSQRPITFTVGKFATLSLVTVVSCCRACYSYYMLLHNMHGD